MIKEKELTRHKDDVSAARRNMPWVEITDDYMFEGAYDKVSLSDLFGDKSQLIIQHFMFGPDWQEGCPSCSYMADSHNDPKFTLLSAISKWWPYQTGRLIK